MLERRRFVIFNASEQFVAVELDGKEEVEDEEEEEVGKLDSEGKRSGMLRCGSYVDLMPVFLSRSTRYITISNLSITTTSPSPSLDSHFHLQHC